MPRATVFLSVFVTLEVPAEYAAKVTLEDLEEMATNAVTDPLDDVQVIVDHACQFAGPSDNSAIFAPAHSEKDECTDIELGDEFERAIEEQGRRMKR